MSVRFVLGPAGSGKTHLCIREMAEAISADPLGPPLLFLVPQQATYQHERLLAAACPGGGFVRAEITSLARLARRAYAESGTVPPPALSEAGKLLLMANAVSGRERDLRVFAAACRRAGFVQQLVAAAEELQTYGVQPERLAEIIPRLAEAGDEAAAAKLDEICALYGDYLRLGQPAYGSHSLDMAYLAQRIRQGWLAQTQVWIDGWADFTPADRQVIAAMFASCPRVTLCLCLDPAQAERNLRPDQPFYPRWHSYAQVQELARKEGMEVEPLLPLAADQGRFTTGTELAELERFWAGWAQKEQEEPPKTIFLTQAQDKREELEYAGREIVRLAREEGLRFRDMGLICREAGDYQHLLPAVLGGLGVPYFLDSKKPLLYHPLIELVRAALEVWAFRPRYAQVQRLLKNPLGPLTPEQGDSLENYCLAHGVRFFDWTRDGWDFPLLNDEDEAYRAEMEAVARQAADYLRPLLELGREASVCQLNHALRRLLEAGRVGEKLAQWKLRAEEEGRGEDAYLHEQAEEKLMDFLDLAELLLGDRVFPAAQLGELFDIALSGLTASTIPAGLDQVLVSSLERSRNPELQAAFVLGANDGVLPRRVQAAGLLGDGERKLLSRYGLELAPDAVSRQLEENYLAYIALTRSGSRLYVSYCSQDEQGQSLLPSSLVRRMRDLFPGLSPSQPRMSAALLTGGPADSEALAKELRDPSPLWRAVAGHYQEDERLRQELAGAEQGLAMEAVLAPLTPATRARLFGSTLRGSASRLERFRRCPFSYFASYSLKLAPRREYKLSPADRGELFHQVLSQAGRYISEHNIPWDQVDESIAEALVDESLRELLPRFLAGVMTSSARYRYLSGRIRSALVHAILLTAEQLAAGDFRPVCYELAFGSGEEGSLPALSIPLSDGRTMRLSGRIDRVDMAEGQEAAYFRVVDYKTGQASLNQEDMAAGLQVQLMVYLQTVLANSARFTPLPPRPAGLYYSSIQDSLVSVDQPQAQSKPGLKLNGLTLADPEAVLLGDAGIHGHSRVLPVGYNPETGRFYAAPSPLSQEELDRLTQELISSLKNTAAALLEGMIQAAPLRDGKHDACKSCDFLSVCGWQRDLALLDEDRAEADPEYPREDDQL